MDRIPLEETFSGPPYKSKPALKQVIMLLPHYFFLTHSTDINSLKAPSEKISTLCSLPASVLKNGWTTAQWYGKWCSKRAKH